MAFFKIGSEITWKIGLGSGINHSGLTTLAAREMIKDISLYASVADPGCLYLIPDPNFPSRVQGQKIPDLGFGSASKNLGIFNPQNRFYALGNMIWDVRTGFWIRRLLIFYPSRIQGSKRPWIPDPRHCLGIAQHIYINVPIFPGHQDGHG
jgi:hypothetical protein